MSLIPNNAPKPDLFLYEREPQSNNFIDVTNYKIDDFLSLIQQEQSELIIMCLYESSTLNNFIINAMIFGISGSFRIEIIPISGNIETRQVPYNNKVYYYYYEEEA